MATAQLLDFVSMSALNIAVPAISHDLHLSSSYAAWIPLAYALPLASLLLPMGRLGDCLGYKPLFVFGVSLMAVSNVLCALSPNSVLLITFRAVQGVGAAANMPNAAAVVANLYEAGPPRGKAMGIIGSMSAMGSALGLLLGGILTQTLGWRWIFWGMLPVSIVLSIAAPLLLPSISISISQHPSATADSPPNPASDLGNFDLAGTFTWIVGIVSIVYVLSTTVGSAWYTSYNSILLLTLGLVSLLIFTILESRLARVPLLPISLFLCPPISINALLILLARGSAAMFVYLMSLKLQLLLSLDALQTALQSLPMSIAGFLLSFCVALTVRKLGHQIPLIIGFALAVAGASLFLFLVKPGANFWLTTLPSTTLFVIGTPLVFIPAQLGMLHASQPKDFAVVGAIFNTAGQVGGPLAIALQATVMNAVSSKFAHDKPSSLTLGASTLRAHTTITAPPSLPITDLPALAATFDAGNWVIIVTEFVGLGIALAYWLHTLARERRERVQAEDPERSALLRG